MSNKGGDHGKELTQYFQFTMCAIRIGRIILNHFIASHCIFKFDFVNDMALFFLFVLFRKPEYFEKGQSLPVLLVEQKAKKNVLKNSFRVVIDINFIHPGSDKVLLMRILCGTDTSG